MKFKKRFIPAPTPENKKAIIRTAQSLQLLMRREIFKPSKYLLDSSELVAVEQALGVLDEYCNAVRKRFG